VSTDRETSVEEIVVNALVEAGATRKPESPDVLLSDLGLDSLAVADVALALEDRLGVRLLEVEEGVVYSVGDVVGAVERGTVPRSRIPPGFGGWQQSVKRLSGPMIRWYTSLEVVGDEHVPSSGPVIIAPNHRSMLDIPALVIACPRPVAFMAKIELYRNRPVSFMWRKLASFPVRREVADLRALDTALALLEQREAVAVYPEGTRNRHGGSLLPFLEGAAWLGLHTGVPIVPCGVRGTGPGDPLRKRRTVRVAFGEPIRVEREPDLAMRRERQADITNRLAASVTSLLL
jgi:1-acyl-sn-glycerol-3-phosphate acyltransferase